MKNEVEFTIKNLNREKIFKEIIKITEINDVKYDDKIINFKVKQNSSKKVEKLLINKGANILNKRQKGLFVFLKNTILRVGVIIPIIIFLIFILICNNFILKTQIIGINLISEQEVLEVLQQSGIDFFTQKSEVNLKELENNIQKIDKVSLVSCIIRGNTLVVNIKEKVYNSEFEEKDKFLPLVSEYDGIITELTVIQGTPVVSVGQTIKAGQQLVLPYVIDSNGNKLAVKAMADIKADVFYNTLTQVSENYIVYQDTGNVCYNRELFLFGNKIFSTNTKCNFKHFRVEQANEYVGEKSILPIKYVKTKYIEQEQIYVENYFSTNKQKILEDCKQKTHLLTVSSDIIKDEYFNVEELAGIVNISYTILVNKSVVKI